MRNFKKKNFTKIKTRSLNLKHVKNALHLQVKRKKKFEYTNNLPQTNTFNEKEKKKRNNYAAECSKCEEHELRVF